jgi:wyosine [tRNA(Phe)-imidazoG37] synthetase (radical SAM superfamily)
LPHNVIFGPVSSRRLGISLGIDIVPMSLCSFDCIYCELGQTSKKTTKRKEYIHTREVDEALEQYFKGESPPHLDYVTFSGSGEPTLHSNISHFIAKVKTLTETPVAILTNSSLLPDPRVRRDIMGADLVVPSLDAATQEVFERINRPAPGIGVRDVTEGIRLFAKEFGGQVWLEILFVEGVNDGPSEVEALIEATRRINPTRVQLGTVVRPPSEGDVYPIDSEDLERIASEFRAGLGSALEERHEGAAEDQHETQRETATERARKTRLDGTPQNQVEGEPESAAESLPDWSFEAKSEEGLEDSDPEDTARPRPSILVDVIPMSRRVGERDFSRHRAERVIAMLRIRPVTLDELCDALGMHRREALKYIDALRRDHKIETRDFKGKTHYTVAS